MDMYQYILKCHSLQCTLKEYVCCSNKMGKMADKILRENPRIRQ
jgi:hypothetical protein